MSDSKRDLTSIEDLGEYLHQLDDEEDYLPEVPDESEPPTFMEETLITNDSFISHEEESTPSFESDVTDFSSTGSFEDSNDFGTSTDFSSSESTFEDSSNFEDTTNFETTNEFSLEGSDSEGDPFSTDESSLPSEDEDLFSNDFATTSDDTALFEIETETETETKLDEEFIKDIPMEKTPLPQMEASPPYQAPENFEDLKKFAESSNFTGMASEGNPSFSILLKEIKFLEDAQDILTLLKELGLAMDSEEVLLNRLTRGEFLIPRISEYAATLLAHKLRRFDIDILVGLSDQIHPPKHTEGPEVGLVSKQNLYQNQAHHFHFDDVSLDISQIIVSATPTLDGYQVLKYIGVASEHKMLEGHLVEDENSVEISSHYHELAQKLKAHALKGHANAVVGLNYQLTPLPSHYGTSSTRYRLTCTGNLVWINRI